jgi:hypothetical protein
MQILSAIYVLLPQTVAANKATACVGGHRRRKHFGVEE